MDDILLRLKEGTADQADLEALEMNLNRLRELEAILNMNESDQQIYEEPDAKILKRARRIFLRKATIRVIVSILSVMLVIAMIVCGIIFIPSCRSAARNQVLDRQQCLDIAEDYLEELSGEKRESFYVRDCDKEVRIKNGLNDSLFVYEIKISTPNGVEYELEVSTRSGFVIVDDYDLIR